MARSAAAFVAVLAVVSGPSWAAAIAFGPFVPALVAVAFGIPVAVLFGLDILLVGLLEGAAIAFGLFAPAAWFPAIVAVLAVVSDPLGAAAIAFGPFVPAVVGCPCSLLCFFG